MKKDFKDTLMYRLLKVKEQIRRDFKESFTQEDIKYENFVVMLYISQHPGLTQAELAERSNRDRNVIGQIIDRFEGLAMVRRARDEKDRRAYRLFLTEAGQKMVSQNVETFQKIEGDHLAPLTKEEQALLIRLLDKIMEA